MKCGRIIKPFSEAKPNRGNMSHSPGVTALDGDEFAHCPRCGASVAIFVDQIEGAGMSGRDQEGAAKPAKKRGTGQASRLPGSHTPGTISKGKCSQCYVHTPSLEKPLAEPTGYTLHKGFRIYLPEEADFEKDGKGRYVVHVRLRREHARYLKRIEVPDCFGKDLHDAQTLSIEMAMRLIDDKNHPWLKRVRKRVRRH